MNPNEVVNSKSVSMASDTVCTSNGTPDGSRVEVHSVSTTTVTKPSSPAKARRFTEDIEVQPGIARHSNCTSTHSGSMPSLEAAASTTRCCASSSSQGHAPELE